MEEISKRLNRQILKALLSRDIPARLMVSDEVLHYVDVILVENNQMACLLFMNDHLDELMVMDPKNVKVARQAMPDLLKLLRNNTLSYD